jgi:hypothetical protein
VALLIIDEVGFEPMNRQEASLFFRLRVVLCSPVPPNTYQLSPRQAGRSSLSGRRIKKPRDRER